MASLPMGGLWRRVRGRPSLTVSAVLAVLIVLQLLSRVPGLSRVWGELVDPSYLTLFQLPDVFRWWAVYAILGLAVTPLTQDLTRHLPDRGVVLNKGIGLLLATYLAWIAGSLHIIPYNRTPPWVWVGLVVAISLGAARLFHMPLRRPDHEDVRRWALAEVTFIGLLLFYILIEVHNPYTPIHHGVAGLDTAIVLAIGRSDWFPPMDPWLSGWRLNYYYIGHVGQSLLWRLTGTGVGVANSLSMVSVIALATQITLATGWAMTRRWWLGFLAATTVGFATNLDMVAQIIEHRGLQGLSASHTEQLAPLTLTDPPYITFTLGELHAELLAVPLLALVCAVLFALGTADRARIPRKRRVIDLVLAGLTIGIVGVTNLYSLPVAVGLCALMYAALFLRDREGWLAVEGAIVLVLSFVAYLPFYLTFRSPPTSKFVMNADPTSPVAIALMFGMFLLPLMVWAYLSASRRPEPSMTSTGSVLRLLALLEVAAGLVIFWFVFTGGTRWVGALFYGAALLVCLERAATGALSRAEIRVVFAWVLAALSCGALWGIEIFNLDVPAPNVFPAPEVMVPMRFNVAWKTYLSVWAPFALASSFAIAMLIEYVGARRWRVLARGAAILSVGLVVLGLLSSAFYTVIRMNYWNERPGLDGLVFMRDGIANEQEEYWVIRWLQRNGTDDDVILETPSGRAYPYTRMSTYTGISTLMGWDHVTEGWHGMPPTTKERMTDAAAIYLNPNPSQTVDLLRKYDIRYIVIGTLEEQTYGRVDRDGLQRIAPIAYEYGHTLLLRVPEDIVPPPAQATGWPALAPVFAIAAVGGVLLVLLGWALKTTRSGGRRFLGAASSPSLPGESGGSV